jgi:hypothetical protein
MYYQKSVTLGSCDIETAWKDREDMDTRCWSIVVCASADGCCMDCLTGSAAFAGPMAG